MFFGWNERVMNRINSLEGKIKECVEDRTCYKELRSFENDSDEETFWIKTTFSQAGEDSILLYVLRVLGVNICKARYLDLGANHARELSNTYALYQRGMRGVLVEANPVEAPGKTKQQLYVALNYWVTATFKDKQAITLNDKEAGCIIVSSTIDAIADHTGTLYRYVVSITPVIKIDIKEGKVRVTYTVQNYDILKVEDGGWFGSIGSDKEDNNRRNQTSYSDGKRLKNDNTDRRLYDEQWEIVKHYPFVPKDAQKRTCSKALVMTHAYSNAIMDKVEEAVKNGITGADDDDW